MIDSMAKNFVTICYQIYYSSNRIFFEKDFSFSIIHFSFFLNIVNLSIRLTKYYIRRIKSGRNFIYDKNIKKFSDLTEDEKNLIYFPKLSVLGIHEIFENSKTNQFYSPFYRCQ
jgi:hypothetical protein